MYISVEVEETAVLPYNSLPLGFRFRPTDEELIDYYLRSKINGNNKDVRVIREIDICKCEPWDLPDLSVIQTKDREWFFFCPRDRKYPNGRRLNRATRAGYWKATGKDRRIKSGVSLIGMKKTLVFYTGRAPKGKRTYWVMHEYRATQKELDGTNPGQSAFVLCRLFKKQEENIDGSNCDEVEPTVSSPTTANFSPEEMQSELALVQESPVLNEKHPTNEECCLAENSDRTASDSLAPVECHNNGCNAYDAEDQVADVTASEVDLQLVADLNFFYDPLPDSQDCILFSPLHSQMHMEPGSSCSFPVTNELSSGHSGVQFQYGTNEPDAYISEFLDSVLNNTDEYSCEETGSPKNSAIEGETPKNMVFVKDSGSRSESDVEVVLGIGRSEGSFLYFDHNVDIKDALQMETTPGDYQTLTSEYNIDEEMTNLGLLRNDPYKPDAFSSGSGVEPFCNLIGSLEELTSHTKGIGSGYTGTGIRTRPRQPQNHTCNENSVAQGNAPRRIRLQHKLVKPVYYIKKSRDWSGPDNYESKLVTEEGKATEEYRTAGDTNSATSTMNEPQKKSPLESSGNSKVSQELSASMRLKFRAHSKISTSAKVLSVFSKTPTRHSIWSFVYMSRVVLVMVVVISFAGIWRCVIF